MRTGWVEYFALLCIFGLSLALTPISSIAADTCADARATMNVQRNIESFMDCLNTCNINDVSDAVQCLPDKCLITLTMSPQSAQRACTLGGCQLPRIILDCPGPSAGLRFRPSFLMCPVDSKAAGDQFGKDRIEIGEDNVKFMSPVKTTFGNSTFDMKMADVPIPPGNYVAMELADVLSQATGRIDRNTRLPDVTGTKSCNACHEAPPNPAGAPPPTRAMPQGSIPVTDRFGTTLIAQLSTDISPFGVFNEGLAQYTIGTNDPIERMVRVGPGMATKGSDGMPLVPVDVLRQGLLPICQCIKDPARQDAIAADNNAGQNFPKDQNGRGLGDATPNPNIRAELGVMARLCDMLNTYTTGPRGPNQASACGTAPGTSCSGVAGGGKFLQQTSAAVSILSLALKGEAVTESTNSFSFTDIDGDVSAFNYLTRTLISPVYLSSLTVIQSGSGDLVVSGTGVALVNGVSTNIQLNVSKISGVVTFQIVNSDTGMSLAGGTGESRLSSLQFVTNTP